MLTKCQQYANNIVIVMNHTSNKYIRFSVSVPEQLLERVDKYCDKVMPGNPKIRSAVIRQAIERFLNDEEKEKEMML